LDGNASAGYVLKLNANGKVAQMVLGSNASSGTGATSIVSFLADTFKIDNDAGSSVSPFIVSGGSVFIDNARITNLSGTKIAANTITADRINVTDLALNFEAATVSGTTIGAWQNNTMRLLKVADLGTEAGVYHIFCRVFGSTGQVKTLSIVAGDGTFGSGASFELRNDFAYTDGAAPTIPTADQGYAQYHSGQSQYWSAIDRFDSANEMVQKDFMVRKVSNTSRTLRLYILAQGDGSNRYLSNVQYGFYKFSEI
jgi:hypothetical protein